MKYLSLAEWYDLPYFYDISYISVVKKEQGVFGRTEEIFLGDKIHLPHAIREYFESADYVITGIYPRGNYKIVLILQKVVD